MDNRYQSFDEFWPFYLSEHANATSRKLHLIGSTLVILFFGFCLISAHFAWLPFGLLIGYGFAWAGHFIFEKNRPATFQYPLWSLRGDFKMLTLFYRGKLSEELKKIDGRKAAN